MKSISSATLVLALLALPSRLGHMSMWSKSQYGFNGGDEEPVTPLAKLPFKDWWFHGYSDDKPAEIMTIVPGKPLQIQISCRKSVSAFGSNPSTDACPLDSGAYHAGGTSFVKSGWTGNSESNLAGCALAIAPKSSASSTNPEDFVIMSIQENCVRQRDTMFDIPANLPSCPDGECTCAWFWQGKISAPQMYMSGFRCRVEGGRAVPWPKPVEPRRHAIEGPTQPMYWANDRSNIGYTPVYDADRPSYNAKWGWKNGAQTDAFGRGGIATPTSATVTTRVGTTTQQSSFPSSLSTSTAAAGTGNNGPTVTVTVTITALPIQCVAATNAVLEKRRSKWDQ